MVTAASKTTLVVASEWSRYATEREKAILDRLVSREHGKVADRLNCLIEMFAEDEEVDRLVPESVQSIAEFFIGNDPPHPAIVADYDGTLAVEWRLPLTLAPDEKWQNCDGILCMEFLLSGEIEYFGGARAVGDEKELRIEGVASQKENMQEIAPFLRRLGN
ncbi:MAG: hypothetical protein OXH73_01315 [Caldilineaceae bacterium]|nr:hypothetical protein [Caldilineaceae bacterium]